MYPRSDALKTNLWIKYEDNPHRFFLNGQYKTVAKS